MIIMIVPVTEEAQRLSAYQIREQVFIQEQRVPPEVERDALDEQALHVLAVVSQTASVAAGTARAFENPEDRQEVMIGRVAVLPAYRGQGIARRMTQWLIDWAREGGYKRARLHAQSYIVPLYAGLGFKNVGAEFFEAGISHQEMILEL